MKGSLIVFDRLDGVEAAAQLQDGKLIDLLIDPQASDRPAPGSIYRARALRPMKGQGGLTVDLGQGQRGYIRQGKGIKEGASLLVQIGTYAEGGKAAPAQTKLVFKSRYAIVTPDNRGLNIARSIHDEDILDRLHMLAREAMQEAPESFGLIIRSAAKDADEDAIFNDIQSMLNAARAVSEDRSGPPELLLAAPSAYEAAWINWTDPSEVEIVEEAGAFDHLGILDQIDALGSPRVDLKSGGYMFIEPTSALVAVDVNTGSDMSLGAGLKANFEAFKDLPRQLRLRGLGGQITIDVAPYPKKDRKMMEQTIRAALKADSIETAFAGITPLGHFELQRKRERLPLREVLKR